MSCLNKILALGAFFVAVGLLWLLAPAQGVPILAYHMVNEDPQPYSIDTVDFDRHMKYLAEQGYSAISLTEYFMARDGQTKLPDKPIIITFDDGYADNYLTALPILEKYQLKATVFVISEAVGQPNYLTWEQIKAMQFQHTEIGSHTASHIALGQADVTEKRRQIAKSKKTLEQNLGTPVDFLAYPFGSYDADIFPLLAETGYRGACTGVPGYNSLDQHVYTLKRISIPRPKYGLWEFKLRMLRASIYSKLGL